MAQVSSDLISRDLVLVGGGHAHALVLRALVRRPLENVRITVINPSASAPYTGMLPGAIAGHYTQSDLMIDVAALARACGARLVLERAVALDPASRQVRLESGRVIGFDIASLDIGISSDLPQVEGFAAHAHAAKPLGAYAKEWEVFVAHAPPTPHVIIVGGGIGGVELALASAHRLRAAGKNPVISVIERKSRALSGVSTDVRKALFAAMKRYGITLRTEAQLAQILARRVILGDGQVLPSDFTLAVAGGRPQRWLDDTGLKLHEGFVAVGPTLQSSDPTIFAVGDCAHMGFAPRQKAGVFAVRQAPILLHNLRAALSGASGKALRKYHPQKDYLKLISLGDKSALSDTFLLRRGGPWLWRLKDWIDRTFMAQFSDIKQLSGRFPSDAPQPVFMLAEPPSLPKPQRADVLCAQGGAAARLTFGRAQQQYVQTAQLCLGLEGRDPAILARLTVLEALGGLWAQGARPQAGFAHLTVPRFSKALYGRVMDETTHALSAALHEAGADLAACDVSLGETLSLWLGVTGLGKAGVGIVEVERRERRPSQGKIPRRGVLVLSKPLGSGIILTAQNTLARPFDGAIMGDIWESCLRSMLTAPRAAAEMLAPQAYVMRAVGKEGLARSVLGILSARRNARVSLSAVPIMEGAEMLAQRGYKGPLALANRMAAEWHIEGDILSPPAELLFDPQTCGGIVAIIPPDAVEEMQGALKAQGAALFIIGSVEDGEGWIVLDP